MRGTGGKLLLLMLLVSLLAAFLVIGCHMHPPTGQTSLDAHCVVCDLECTFVAIVAFVLAMLRFKLTPFHRTERRQVYRAAPARSLYIRPPPVFSLV